MNCDRATVSHITTSQHSPPPPPLPHPPLTHPHLFFTSLLAHHSLTNSVSLTHPPTNPLPTPHSPTTPHSLVPARSLPFQAASSSHCTSPYWPSARLRTNKRKPITQPSTVPLALMVVIREAVHECEGRMGMHATCWTSAEGSREAKRKQRVKLRKLCAKLCHSTRHMRERTL